MSVEFQLTVGETAFSAAGHEIRRTVLASGVRILSTKMPQVRALTLGAWVGVGSRDEDAQHAGATHFLEHLLFKGTQQRSAFDIAVAFDEIGGDTNALTAKEYTCYYARTLDEDMPLSVSVLLDMITSAKIAPADFERERGVILEELAMIEDDPVNVVHEQAMAAFFGAHTLGRPIGGTPESILAVTREQVWEHYQTHYLPAGLVITAAGNVDHDHLVELVTVALGAGGWDLATPNSPLARRSREAATILPATNELHVPRDLEQSHLVIALPGFPLHSSQRFAFSVANTVLGGGMSSRLFQEVREKRGLAYSTYSFHAGYVDTGMFGMYAATAPEKMAEAKEVMLEQLQELADTLTPAELTRAQGQLAGSLALGLEETAAHMTNLGRVELLTGEYLSVDQVIDRIKAVTIDEVRVALEQVTAAELVSVTVGTAE